MSPLLKSILGPRVPLQEGRKHRGRFVAPMLLLALGGILFVVSSAMPWWNMTLHAPQYPKGLHLEAHLNSISGDVQEIDTLNHYIGMRPLGEAATLERKLAWLAVASMALLIVAAIFIHSKWAALCVLPAISFPYVFLADLAYWMNDFGQNLDPHAALSKAIKPFTPPVLGRGTIGQFHTDALPGTGMWLAFAAGIILIAALWFHRRAYKPLADRAQVPA